MPRLADEVREERRARFIEAARRCSATKGYRTLTIDDVCAEAGGLSKGAFYTYFGSKQDLLVALLEDDAVRVEGLIALLSDAPVSESERSQRFLREILKLGEDSAEVQRRIDLWSEMLADEAIRERLGAAVARRRTLLARWIETGSASGELVDIPRQRLRRQSPGNVGRPHPAPGTGPIRPPVGQHPHRPRHDLRRLT
jgi:AcrR family transcriptional regulator